jgi:DNA-binding NarL/FixJ family response regulator
VQLVIVDDHQMFSASLTRLLSHDADLDVVGTAMSVADLTTLLTTVQPDIAVVDWQLGDGDGADAIKVIRRAAPGTRVLVLTGNLDDATLQRAVSAGSDGLVTKDRPPDDLVAAIRTVGRGEVAFDPSALARVVGTDGHGPSPELSDRELEIVRLVADGGSNKDIATALYLSPNTVRNHIHRISTKLGASTRLEVVIEAARRGLIDLPR